ncbi:MAG TPA: PQQ-dependent sugar dehydrogenase [Caulobacteraceae bacterium]|nr:PQQ-dependent sugar dehydrogenase [Caulobacteraceae bacterium]
MVRISTAVRSAVALTALAAAPAAIAQVRTGDAAFGDWRTDAPGVVRKISATDMPESTGKFGVAVSARVPQPKGAEPKALPGFTVTQFAEVENARLVRTAPNGDIFVAATESNLIQVLRAPDGANEAAVSKTFAKGLDRPFGIAFYPAGPNPKWVYVANVNSVVRFPYQNGDLQARGPAEVLVAHLTEDKRGHSTRDVAFTADGKRMLISVGSGSNVAEEMPKKTPEETKAWADANALGATWGKETDRADVLSFDPEGHDKQIFATGIRNCVGLAVQPTTHDVWCSTNERDLLGDNLPPDYVTRVHEHGFYGWPWYYIGANEDPRLKGARPDLADKVTVPDVLIQAHSAPLAMTFYTARSGPAVFPTEYRGDAFVALHGSWNRAKRTGYKVVRLPLKNGVPTGEYEDFLTGFVVDDKSVWGRPVGVTVAHDGALLVADDGGDAIWRVAYSHGAAK